MTDDPYIECPRCKGDGGVFAITQPGNDYFPTRSEYFPCPFCKGAKTMHRDDVAKYHADAAEDDDE